MGVVLRVELAGRSTIYRVQFASGSRYLGEEQLETATLDPLDRVRDRSFGHLHAYHLRLRALLLEHAYRYDAYSGLANARIELKPHLGRIGHITLGVVPWSGQKPRTLSRRSRKPVIARSIYPCWCDFLEPDAPGRLDQPRPDLPPRPNALDPDRSDHG